MSFHNVLFLRHLSMYTMQECIDPNNNLGTQRFIHLDVPAKYQQLTSITIMISLLMWITSIIRSSIYHTNTSTQYHESKTRKMTWNIEVTIDDHARLQAIFYFS